MAYGRRFLGIRVPDGWDDVLIGALKTIVIAFVALVAWDWVESGDFDPVGVGSNAAVVALALFILDAVLVSTVSADR
jgi:hypothetical protein